MCGLDLGGLIRYTVTSYCCYYNFPLSLYLFSPCILNNKFYINKNMGIWKRSYIMIVVIVIQLMRCDISETNPIQRYYATSTFFLVLNGIKKKKNKKLIATIRIEQCGISSSIMTAVPPTNQATHAYRHRNNSHARTMEA